MHLRPLNRSLRNEDILIALSRVWPALYSVSDKLLKDFSTRVARNIVFQRHVDLCVSIFITMQSMVSLIVNMKMKPDFGSRVRYISYSN
jgi:hypothetical protein